MPSLGGSKMPSLIAYLVLSCFGNLATAASISANATTTSTRTATIVSTTPTLTSMAASGTSSAATPTSSSTTSTSHITLILLIAIPSLIVVASIIKRVLKHRAATRANEKNSPTPNVFYIQATPPPPVDPRLMAQPNGLYTQAAYSQHLASRAQEYKEPYHVTPAAISATDNPFADRPMVYGYPPQVPAVVKKKKKWFG